MLNLNSVMLGTDNKEALTEFYTKVLGKPAWEDEGYVGWRVGEGNLMIGAHSEVKGQNEMPGRIILNFETADVKGEFARIKGLGAQVSHEPYQPGDGGGDFWMATFADPDGNYFQIVSPMPEDM